MYDTHHFTDTRSVKQSEALPLASRGCWLPFCRLPTSSHHPFVRSRLTIPGHLSSPRLVSPNAPSHAPSHASPQARVRRCESSRVVLHLAPFHQSQPFSVLSSAATSRYSARTVALKYPPSPCASSQLNSFHPNPTRPIPSDQSSPSPSAHLFADISHR